jgi:hypothetical protein
MSSSFSTHINQTSRKFYLKSTYTFDHQNPLLLLVLVLINGLVQGDVELDQIGRLVPEHSALVRIGETRLPLSQLGPILPVSPSPRQANLVGLPLQTGTCECEHVRKRCEPVLERLLAHSLYSPPNF